MPADGAPGADTQQNEGASTRTGRAQQLGVPSDSVNFRELVYDCLESCCGKQLEPVSLEALMRDMVPRNVGDAEVVEALQALCKKGWVCETSGQWRPTTDGEWGKHVDDTRSRHQGEAVAALLHRLEDEGGCWKQKLDGLKTSLTGDKKDKLEKRLKDKVVRPEWPRALLYACCGFGKTVVAYKVLAELLKKHCSDSPEEPFRALVLVPNLSLIKQTAKRWLELYLEDHNSGNLAIRFRVASVCSLSDLGLAGKCGKSAKVDGGGAATEEEVNMFRDDKDLQKAEENWSNILTDESKVKDFRDDLPNDLPPESCVLMFCTYQSAFKLLETSETLSTVWDLSILDEVHRAVADGTSKKKTDQDLKAFQMALYDNCIRSRRRLLMTATPRLRPASRAVSSSSSAEAEDTVMMDDEDVYGSTTRYVTAQACGVKDVEIDGTYTMSLDTAIELGLVCDYKLLVHAVCPGKKSTGSNSFLEILKSDVVDKDGNQIHVIGKDKSPVKPLEMARIAGVEHAMGRLDPGPVKAFAFHSEIDEARRFADLLGDERLFNQAGTTKVFQVDSKQKPPIVNADRLKTFLCHEGSAIVSNCNMLGTGIDCDSLVLVIFGSNKTSIVSVIQQAGRAFRLQRGKDGRTQPNRRKVAYVLLCLFELGEDAEDTGEAETDGGENIGEEDEAPLSEDEDAADYSDMEDDNLGSDLDEAGDAEMEVDGGGAASNLEEDHDEDSGVEQGTQDSEGGQLRTGGVGPSASIPGRTRHSSAPEPQHSSAKRMPPSQPFTGNRAPDQEMGGSESDQDMDNGAACPLQVGEGTSQLDGQRDGDASDKGAQPVSEAGDSDPKTVQQKQAAQETKKNKRVSLSNRQSMRIVLRAFCECDRRLKAALDAKASTEYTVHRNMVQRLASVEQLQQIVVADPVVEVVVPEDLAGGILPQDIRNSIVTEIIQASRTPASWDDMMEFVEKWVLENPEEPFTGDDRVVETSWDPAWKMGFWMKNQRRLKESLTSEQLRRVEAIPCLSNLTDDEAIAALQKECDEKKQNLSTKKTWTIDLVGRKKRWNAGQWLYGHVEGPPKSRWAELSDAQQRALQNLPGYASVKQAAIKLANTLTATAQVDFLIKWARDQTGKIKYENSREMIIAEPPPPSEPIRWRFVHGLVQRFQDQILRKGEQELKMGIAEFVGCLEGVPDLGKEKRKTRGPSSKLSMEVKADDILRICREKGLTKLSQGRKDKLAVTLSDGCTIIPADWIKNHKEWLKNQPGPQYGDLLNLIASPRKRPRPAANAQDTGGPSKRKQPMKRKGNHEKRQKVLAILAWADKNPQKKISEKLSEETPLPYNTLDGKKEYPFSSWAEVDAFIKDNKAQKRLDLLRDQLGDDIADRWSADGQLKVYHGRSGVNPAKKSARGFVAKNAGFDIKKKLVDECIKKLAPGEKIRYDTTANAPAKDGVMVGIDIQTTETVPFPLGHWLCDAIHRLKSPGSKLPKELQGHEDDIQRWMPYYNSKATGERQVARLVAIQAWFDCHKCADGTYNNISKFKPKLQVAGEDTEWTWEEINRFLSNTITKNNTKLEPKWQDKVKRWNFGSGTLGEKTSPVGKHIGFDTKADVVDAWLQDNPGEQIGAKLTIQVPCNGCNWQKGMSESETVSWNIGSFVSKMLMKITGPHNTLTEAHRLRIESWRPRYRTR